MPVQTSAIATASWLVIHVFASGSHISTLFAMATAVGCVEGRVSTYTPQA